MRNLPPFLRMVWETHRGYTAAIVVLRLLRAFVPLASLWIGKLIIDAVVRSAESGGRSGARWPRSWRWSSGVVTLGELLARAGALLESLLGDLFSNRMSVRLMEHAAELDLQHFEDPTFYDRLERARRHTVGRIALLSQLLGLAQNTLTLVTLIGTLLAFSPLLFVLLVAAVLPSFLGETHFAALGYSLLFSWTPERRKLDYYRLIAASDKTAKEVKLFGLSRYLIDQYRALADDFYLANRSLAIRRGVVGMALSLVSTLGYYAAYGTIIYRVVLGRLTIGDLTLLGGTFSHSRTLIQGMLLSTSELYEQALFLEDLFVFLGMRPSIAAPRAAGAVSAARSAGGSSSATCGSGTRKPRGRANRRPRTGTTRRGGCCAGSRSGWRRGKARPGGRERRGEDDAHQAHHPPVRSHARRDPAGRPSRCATTIRRSFTPTWASSSRTSCATTWPRRRTSPSGASRRWWRTRRARAAPSRTRRTARWRRGDRGAPRALPHDAGAPLRGRGGPERRAVAESGARTGLTCATPSS
jgi:hypothetical protein